jgi:hypothetical protein
MAIVTTSPKPVSVRGRSDENYTLWQEGESSQFLRDE